MQLKIWKAKSVVKHSLSVKNASKIHLFESVAMATDQQI